VTDWTDRQTDRQTDDIKSLTGQTDRQTDTQTDNDITLSTVHKANNDIEIIICLRQRVNSLL